MNFSEVFKADHAGEDSRQLNHKMSKELATVKYCQVIRLPADMRCEVLPIYEEDQNILWE